MMKNSKNLNELRNLITSAKEVLREMKIDYNSVVGPRTKKLIDISKQIIPIIKEDYPEIADVLENATKKIISHSSRIIQSPQPQIFQLQIPYQPSYQVVNYDYINAYSFGDIRTTIKILDALYSVNSQNFHKIFISHSSKDKRIVSEFNDRILRLGIGISADDIFCTSIEDMNIENGEDIRKHIKNNILSADFSFLLISENYKKSEICLNEMGAVWTNNNNVRYYILPNTSFDKIGWLCSTKQAEQITDNIALDKLYNELVSYYSLEGRIESWSRQRETFVNNILLNEFYKFRNSK